MQTVANDNLSLTEISSSKRLVELQKQIPRREFYRQMGVGLLKADRINQELNHLGKRLVLLAHNAYAYRQRDGLEQISQMLMSLPFPKQLRSVGSYYHSIKLKREGSLDQARLLLESLIDEVPVYYRGRVIMSLGALYFDSGQFQASMPLFMEASRAASVEKWQDLYTQTGIQRQLAALKGLDGDHIGAVAHLESLQSITRRVGLSCPPVWYDYLNSLAVELGEVGRIEEASNVCKIILASPIFDSRPEWRETCEVIAGKEYKTRSWVGFTGRSAAHRSVRAENVLHLPMPKSAPGSASASTGRAKILNYTDWKKRMSKDPNGDEKCGQDSGEESDRQMLLRIVELASTDDLPDEALYAMVEALESIVKTHKQEHL